MKRASDQHDTRGCSVASRRRARWWILGAFILSAVIFDRNIVRGWLTRAVIVDVSMAPHWLGIHEQVKCPDCGHHDVSEATAEHRPGAKSVCPACGQLTSRNAINGLQAADRVWVDRTLKFGRGPQRWDCIAIVDPRNPRQRWIKRVVGLPGESIDIGQGEVWVAGRLIQKRLAQFQAMAIPVIDTQPADVAQPSPSQRRAAWQSWRCDAPDSQWRLDSRGYTFTSRDHHEAGARNDLPARLVFRGADLDGHLPRPLCLTDDYSFHQTVSRRLEPARDFWWRVEVIPSMTGTLVLEAVAEDESWSAEWETSRNLVRLRHNGVERGQGSIPQAAPAGTHSRRWEWAHWDNRWVVLMDGAPLCDVEDPGVVSPFPAVDDSPVRGWRELAVAATGSGWCLTRVRLSRDLVYRRAESLSTVTWPVTLGPDQYFVVGDNLPQSIDSRHFGAISRSAVWGIVHRWGAQRSR